MLQRKTLRGAAIFSLILGALCLCAPAIPQKESSEVEPSRIVQFLNQTIAWYHQLGAEQQLVSDANDAIFVSANRQTADEVVWLNFQFARNEQEWQSSHGGQQGGVAAATGASPYAQQEAKAVQDANQVQGEVNDLQQKIASAAGSRKQALESQLEETQAEVDLAKARAEAIHNMAQFATSAATSAGGLSAEIDALASTLPATLTQQQATSSTTTASTQAVTSQSVNTADAGTGLWEQGARLLATWGKLRTINGIAVQTQALAASAQDIRAPLIAQLRQLTQRGDQLAQEADTANSATLAQEKQQLDALTQEFKQLTAAAIPIAKIAILLDLYQKNLAGWHTAVVGQLRDQARGLIARILILVIILGIVLGASELWRRAIHRYVRDLRRRSQLHWVRKLVTWAAIAIVVGLFFASKIGSVATFAGLLTAGIAVALQNVIQSVVGYFFLIGKYGIRVGEHVQIGGVTGEVIEVGLVRIHLMEMGGLSEDAPTGRTVAFSNSIVFQPAVGVFKQIPGTNFAWHEITLTLPSDTNFAAVRERLMKAIDSGLAPYKDEIARQHSAMQHSFEVTGGGLAPSVQLQFTAAGVDAKVRYPVALRHSVEIDESVTHALLADLDLDRSTSPTIRLKTSPA